jgi:hypothetical protein
VGEEGGAEFAGAEEEDVNWRVGHHVYRLVFDGEVYWGVGSKCLGEGEEGVGQGVGTNSGGRGFVFVVFAFLM